MDLVSFLRWVADRGSVSVGSEARLDGKKVSLEFTDQPVSSILAIVAR